MGNLLNLKIANLRSRLADRWLDFKPYIQTLPVGQPALRFFHATSQSTDWYDPLGAHLIAEFNWVQQHLGGNDENIIDAGAFHGLYAMVMADAAGSNSRIVAVDPVASNGAIMEANFALNDLRIETIKAAVSTNNASQQFTNESCGRLSSSGSLHVDCMTLPQIMSDATVVKMDIEGAEFSVLPAQIDKMQQVHTWIVEIHHAYSATPESILELFHSRGFELLSLNRKTAQVKSVDDRKSWTDRTSLIAVRR